MAANFVPPVFFKARDIIDFKTLTEYEVYSKVKDIVNTENVTGCQRIGGLWRVYVKSSECRIKLLTNKLTIRDQLINVYNENPFRSGAVSPEEKVVKITIKDIPLSKDNSCIETFLQSKGIVLNKPIQYGKIRNPETKELTDCYSGDRILYTKPFSQDIQRVVYFGPTRARVFYDNQPVQKVDMLCTNCYSTEHFRSKCGNPTACRMCHVPGHKPEDACCDAPKQKAHKNVTVFQGKDDILSNHYMCDIKCHGISAKSSEHAYHYVEAIRKGCPEIAANIRDAPTAALAKTTAKQLPYNSLWEDQKVSVMLEILGEKSKQVPEFKQALLDTKSNKLVEAVRGEFFWGSGLTKEETLHTKSKYWFGKNQMGTLLMQIRDNLQEHTQSRPRGAKNKSAVPTSQSQDNSHAASSDSE